MRLILFFVAVLSFLHVTRCTSGHGNDDSVLDISAFNIRIFGVNKIADKTVLKHLVTILLRYDIILVQEIRDSSGMAIKVLLKELNKEFSKLRTTRQSSRSAAYGMALSPRLGRTASKEEYAYFYRTDLVSLTGSFTFEDKDDVFEREPFVVRFKSSLSAVQDFAIAGIHISPRDAPNEISNLTQVYDAIQRKWQLDDVIIMGDFNAGCDYVKKWEEISLAKDDRFYWIIDHSLDTTSEKSVCPYDRIVAAGQNLVQNILPQSGGAFYYDEELKLSTSEALAISDHYPVHMKIRSQEERLNNWFSESFTSKDARVDQALNNKPHLIYNLRKDAKSFSTYTVSESYKSSGAYSHIEIQRVAKSIREFHVHLQSILTTFPVFVSENQVNMVKRFVKNKANRGTLSHGHGRYKTLYDFYVKVAFDYILKIFCSLEVRSQPTCSLHVSIQEL